jgi:hypothetical protein
MAKRSLQQTCQSGTKTQTYLKHCNSSTLQAQHAVYRLLISGCRSEKKGCEAEEIFTPVDIPCNYEWLHERKVSLQKPAKPC